MDKNLFNSQEKLKENFTKTLHSKNELVQKELEVNHAAQVLLKQRIQMMQEFVNELPASDPQYSMLLAAIQMDQIELDELKLRHLSLLQGEKML